MYNLEFITDENLYNHVKQTILEYTKTLENMNLSKFNSNLVDPIKLLLDKKVSNKTFEEIITLEIQRQRDKTNSNIVGYFHQNIFKYLPDCEVPSKGFDIIYTDSKSKNKIYVELKNKHNTMNSSSSQATYMKMQQHLLNNSNDQCYLVEVIAKTSQNIPWSCSFRGNSYHSENIRRVSIDQFYALITNNPQSFFKLCEVLPKVIDDIINNEKSIALIPQDTVIEELLQKNPNILKSLYLLAFDSYGGFNTINF